MTFAAATVEASPATTADVRGEDAYRTPPRRRPRRIATPPAPLRPSLRGVTAAFQERWDVEMAMLELPPPAIPLDPWPGGDALPWPALEAALLLRTSLCSGAGVEGTCAVCLECFRASDELRTLPCGHRFHRGAAAHGCPGVDRWLRGGHGCPLCRRAL